MHEVLATPPTRARRSIHWLLVHNGIIKDAITNSRPGTASFERSHLVFPGSNGRPQVGHTRLMCSWQIHQQSEHNSEAVSSSDRPLFTPKPPFQRKYGDMHAQRASSLVIWFSSTCECSQFPAYNATLSRLAKRLVSDLTLDGVCTVKLHPLKLRSCLRSRRTSTMALGSFKTWTANQPSKCT